MEIPSSYETVIGLEVHVQLNTKSKAFSGEANLFGAAPNSLVSPISLAHPGTLPRINKKQVEAGLKLGLALGSQFPKTISFDRKNYFYTDLPKGYQITQDRDPICQGGMLPIRLGESYKEIRIHHVHLEEDAGKSIHDKKEKHSLIDLNRAGVPLLEIVTEPDLRSGDEVDAFMSAVRQLVRFLDISDGHMEQGSLRCDVNVSVRKPGEKYGERCEIKNLNSMKFARQAILFERERQIQLLEQGQKVISQTRKFHPKDGSTSPLRSKEEAPDYRYFPEPDMPPYPLSEILIYDLKANQTPLPWQLYKSFFGLGLSANEARILSETSGVASYFEKVLKHTDQAKTVANILIQQVLPDYPDLDKFSLEAEQIAALANLLDGKKITLAALKKLLPAWISQPNTSLESLLNQFDIGQSTSTSELEEILLKVLEAYPKEVAIYLSGNKKLIGFFMGKAMRKLGRNADPQRVTKQLKGLLETKK